MTDDKKHDDKDRKKLSDEEMEDVAGGALKFGHIQDGKGKKKDADKNKFGDGIPDEYGPPGVSISSDKFTR